MPKGPDVKFEDFVTEQNKDAPSTLLAHGLGLSPESFFDVRTQASIAVSDALVEVDFVGDEERRTTFRDLLLAKIAPLLRDTNGAPNQSMLDITTLGLTDDHGIKNFIRRHGVDLDQPEDLAYIHKVFEEATEFLDADIFHEKQKVNPELRKTKTAKGIYAIFKTAAGDGRRILIPQACALLRIAAVINYIERDPVLSLLPDAEAALKDLVRKYIQKDAARRQNFFVTGIPGDFPIALANFELRLKTRNRIIAKLLHKPSNRADEVLDHIGFRITTHNPVDTLRLIYQMFFHPDHPVFPSTYIMIGQSKNLLFDARKMLEVLGDPAKSQDFVMSLTEATLDHAELITVGSVAVSGDNPHSAGTYHAIHIVFEIPITTRHGERRLFPIEIQILDSKTSRANEETAPHGDYVRRQMEAVFRRVTGNNLESAWENRFGKPRKR